MQHDELIARLRAQKTVDEMDPDEMDKADFIFGHEMCVLDGRQAADRIEALHEKLAAAYIALSGTDIHASDCTTSNAPAYEPGPCDCKETDQ